MSNIFKGFFISSMAFLSLTFISCSNDDENIEATQPEFIENIPYAENIKATSAFIPVNTNDLKGHVWICFGKEDDIAHISPKMQNYDLMVDVEHGKNGKLITDLMPDHTYYYTIAYYPDDCTGPIYSKNYGSFTTNSVSIKFTEPATISTDKSSKYALRMKTSGIEEWDVSSNLHVTIYSANYDNKDNKSFSLYATKYIGDGVWQYDNPDKDLCYLAVIRNTEGSIYAKTPIVKLVDGELVELEDNHIFDKIP